MLTDGHCSADEYCRRSLRLEQVEGYADDSGFACQLFVRSHGFAARALFTFERDVFDCFRSGVEAMDRSLKGSARLQPRYEPGFIELTMGPAGAVFVSGEVVRSAEFSQLLRFEFRTDQTCLRRPSGTWMHAQSWRPSNVAIIALRVDSGVRRFAGLQ